MLPFERVALVLQGGGALGAYQAGVYQAIHEAKIDVHWLCGTSIGAINGALIAGNPPDKRVERLRDFWETVTKPPLRIPNLPWFTELPWNGNGHARFWTNKISAFATMVHGAPGFFSPRPFPPVNSTAEDPETGQLLRHHAAEGHAGAAGGFRPDQRPTGADAVHRSRHQCPHRRTGLF